MRRDSAEALGKTKASAALEALIVALADVYWQVRHKAAWSLGQLGDARAIPALGALLLNDAESNVRKEAVLALTYLACGPCKAYLENALLDPDADVRKLARRALGGMGEAIDE